MNIYAVLKHWVFCQQNKVKTSNACSLSHCLNSYDESFSREYLVSGSEDQIKDTFLGFLQLWKSVLSYSRQLSIFIMIFSGTRDKLTSSLREKVITQYLYFFLERLAVGQSLMREWTWMLPMPRASWMSSLSSHSRKFPPNQTSWLLTL